MYPSCPVFCQATSGELTNSLINIMQLLPGTGKMAGADRFLAPRNQAGKRTSEWSSTARVAEVTLVTHYLELPSADDVITHKTPCYIHV